MTYSDELIMAFVTYTRTVDLMRVTGLSKQTIVKYKHSKALQTVVNEHRQEIISTCVRKLQTQLTKCVDTLASIRDDTNNNAQTRINACNSLMNHCRDWTLTCDVLDRLQALERAQNDDN